MLSLSRSHLGLKTARGHTGGEPGGTGRREGLGRMLPVPRSEAFLGDFAYSAGADTSTWVIALESADSSEVTGRGCPSWGCGYVRFHLTRFASQHSALFCPVRIAHHLRRKQTAFWRAVCPGPHELPSAPVSSFPCPPRLPAGGAGFRRSVRRVALGLEPLIGRQPRESRVYRLPELCCEAEYVSLYKLLEHSRPRDQMAFLPPGRLLCGDGGSF